MMEAVFSSEMFVTTNKTLQCHNQSEGCAARFIMELYFLFFEGQMFIEYCRAIFFIDQTN
jgi:hypothetical protein